MINGFQVAFWDSDANNGKGGEFYIDIKPGDNINEVISKMLYKIKELEDKVKQLENELVDQMMLAKQNRS